MYTAAFCAARVAEQVQSPMFSLCEGFGRYYRIIGLTTFGRVMYMTGVLTQRSPDICKGFPMHMGLL